MTFVVGDENFRGHDALDMVLDYLRDPDAPVVERPRAATMREVPRTNTKMIAPDARSSPMTAKIGKLSSKKLMIFRVAACLDGLENGSHVSVTETERARLAIERVANIEQRRGDARLASRFGD